MRKRCISGEAVSSSPPINCVLKLIMMIKSFFKKPFMIIFLLSHAFFTLCMEGEGYTYSEELVFFITLMGGVCVLLFL